MVKTVHKEEHKLLRRILPQYYYHMTAEDKDSLLCRIVGCHVLRLSKNSKIGANKIYFVVMQNVLNTDLDLDVRFDLKGSWVGRREGEEARKKPKSTLKDVDWTEMDEKIRIGPQRKKRLMDALKRDARFLEEKHIIDYSLLIGIHKHNTGGDSSTSVTGNSSVDSTASGRRLRRSSSSSSSAASNLSGAEQDGQASNTNESLPFHQRDNGGMLSTDGTETYAMGVIDFLTLYTHKKAVERIGKSCVFDKSGISVQKPQQYASRFIDFIDNSVVE